MYKNKVFVLSVILQNGWYFPAVCRGNGPKLKKGSAIQFNTVAQQH